MLCINFQVAGRVTLPKPAKKIRATLLTWGDLTVSMEEVGVVIRHWRMLVLYVVSATLTFQFRYPADNLTLDLWLDLLIFIWLHLLPVPIIITIAILVILRSKTKPVYRIYVSPLLFGSIIFSAISTEAIFGLLRGELQFDPVKIVAWSVLAYLLGEIGAATAFNIAIPPILAEIRGVGAVQGNQGTIAEVEPQTSLEQIGPFFSVAGREYSARFLLYIRADGNYVDIVMKNERAFVLATLGSVVSQLETVEGCMVSRSLWVSATAIKTFRRQGKNYLIETVDGTEFRVARSRNGMVVPWLTQRFELAT